MGRLVQIFDFDFKSLAEDFMTWEALIHQFEKETYSLLSSMAKTAVLMNSFKGLVQQHMQLNISHRLQGYQENDLELQPSRDRKEADFFRSDIFIDGGECYQVQGQRQTWLQWSRHRIINADHAGDRDLLHRKTSSYASLTSCAGEHGTA